MAIPNLSDPFKTRGLTALLGPTNTGKTHFAIERMLGHRSGMIGLPLRLLAREVYQRVVDRVGPGQVALITGEEKIKPKDPRFWISTVEAMPRDLSVSFVAIDEAQLAADSDRGHVFTEAMLNRRGSEETILIGASTIRPLLEELLPSANVISRPRLSKLTFAGERKLTRLPPRSAVVAFSAEEVYAIAELLRRERGGAAVVLGALSPRTRNAQVELFQSGEVDVIVATDAIGMGLNLEIDHVAFASSRKFDGANHRDLRPAELGQIAGRAGRHLKDGTFGTTGRCPPFDEELVETLEAHRFDPVRLINWRNADLDFASIEHLSRSLAVAPTVPGLVRARQAEDEVTLDILAGRPAIRQIAAKRNEVEKLWDVCQLPDYRKVPPHVHADLVAALFEAIVRKGRIETDWFAREIAACDRADGDIATLSARVAQIRTWTFCANRSDWLANPAHWQNETRAIEDKLSDALHEKLAQRFIDRRTSVLMRRLRENAMLEAEVTDGGDVLVESQHLGRLEGFRFTPDARAEGPDAKALKAAAAKALAGEIERRAKKLSESNDQSFALSLDGTLRWIGAPVAKLQASEKLLNPRLILIADEHLAGAAREMVEARVNLFLAAHLKKLLGPLFDLEESAVLTGAARGVGYQVAENLGVLERSKVAEVVKGLDQEARAMLRAQGVRFGAHHIYTAGLMKPAQRALAAQLFALKTDPEANGLAEVAHLAGSGRTSIPVDAKISRDLYRVAGFRVCGARAVRVDILERLADLIRPALSWKPGSPGEPPPGHFEGGGFTVTGAMTSLTGCSGEDFASILTSLGYRMEMKPMPKPKPPAPVAAVESGAAEAAPSEPAADGDSGAQIADAESAEPAASTQALADPAPSEEKSTEQPTPVESASETEAAPDADGVSAVSAQSPEAPSESEPTDADAPPAEPAAPEEPPVMVAVWRPGRPDRDRHRRPQDRRPRNARSGERPQGEAQPAPADGEAKPGERRDGPRREHRGPRRDFRPRHGQQANAAAGQQASADGESKPADAAERREDRPRHDKPRDDRPRSDQQNRPQGARPQGDRPQRSDRPWEKRSPRDNSRHDRSWKEHATQDKPRGDRAQPDPNSPFAKLMELKAKLEGKS
jgi:ATP-dependent RNA helicase SUPV3L1/SUV3